MLDFIEKLLSIKKLFIEVSPLILIMLSLFPMINILRSTNKMWLLPDSIFRKMYSSLEEPERRHFILYILDLLTILVIYFFVELGSSDLALMFSINYIILTELKFVRFIPVLSPLFRNAQRIKNFYIEYSDVWKNKKDKFKARDIILVLVPKLFEYFYSNERDTMYKIKELKFANHIAKAELGVGVVISLIWWIFVESGPKGSGPLGSIFYDKDSESINILIKIGVCIFASIPYFIYLAIKQLIVGGFIFPMIYMSLTKTYVKVRYLGN